MTKPTEDGMGQQNLLERLRAQGAVYVDDPVGNIMIEAADEIDRLRTENAKANQRAFAAGLLKDDNPVRVSGYRDHPETIEELRHARDMIVRLKSSLSLALEAHTQEQLETARLARELALAQRDRPDLVAAARAVYEMLQDQKWLYLDDNGDRIMSDADEHLIGTLGVAVSGMPSTNNSGGAE